MEKSKRNNVKWLVAMLPIICILILISPVFTIRVKAEDEDIIIIDEVSDLDKYHSSSTGYVMPEGTYRFTEDLDTTYSSGTNAVQLKVEGNSKFIIDEGKTVIIQFLWGRGDDSSLTINEENGNFGSLYINTKDGENPINKSLRYSYGITADSLTINGGTVVCVATSDAISVKKTATINGGTVIAKSFDSYGSGIAGTNESESVLTINGGNISATGTDDEYTGGPGIETTFLKVIINDGTVFAKGGYNCAGIGGSKGKDGGELIINGGNVTAIGGENAADIGGGNDGKSGIITINGGEVTATGESPRYTGIGYGLYSYEKSGAITLGWTDASKDKITARFNQSVKYAENKTFAFGSDSTMATQTNIKGTSSAITLIPICKINFDSRGGQTFDPILVVANGTVNSLPTPTKEEATFINWYCDEDRTIVFDTNTKIKGDMTLYAGWSNDNIKVTGISIPETMTITVGEYVTLPEVTIIPSNASNKNYEWDCGQYSYFCCDDGIIYSRAIGEYIITVKSEDGNYTASCTVKVIDGKRETVHYLDENGEDKTVSAFVIEKGNSVLLKRYCNQEISEWYVVKDSIDLDSLVLSNSHISLILADGAELKLNSIAGGVSSELNIYSQSNGDSSGKIEILSDYFEAVLMNKLTLFGGRFVVDSDYDDPDEEIWALRVNYVVINGGSLKANVPILTDKYAYGLQGDTLTVNGGDVEISGKNTVVLKSFEYNGGTVIINGSVYGVQSDDCILNWTNSDDSIQINSFNIGNITFAKNFVLGDTSTLATADNIAGQTLRPICLRSFDTGVETQLIAPGETADKPNDPSKRGSVFSGWQYQGEDYSFESVVIGDMELTSVWTPTPLTADQPEDVVYSGDRFEPSVTVKDSVTDETLTKDVDYTVSYEDNIDAGTASVKITGIGDYVDSDQLIKTFKIKKADSTLTLLPEAASVITYNKSSQTLATAGTVMGGSLVYAVTTDGNIPTDTDFSEELPSQTDAGTYTIWYRVLGDKNHNNIEADTMKFEVTIPKATPQYTVPDASNITCLQTAADISLPEGFAVSDTTQELVFGDNSVEVSFTPKDTKNYKNVEGIVVTVTVVHAYGTPVYTWSDDGKKCTATLICAGKNCPEDSDGHMISEDAVITSVIKSDSTQTELGITTYTAEFENPVFSTQTKDVADIPLKPNDDPTPTPTVSPTYNPTSSPTTQPSTMPTSDPTPAATHTTEPSATPVTEPSATPAATPSMEPTTSPASDEPAKVGDIVTDETTKAIVKITSVSEKNSTAAYISTSDTSAKSIEVPDTITKDGVVYKVTEIYTNAFKGSKAKTIIIGKNVSKIKPKAFSGLKVSKIIVKTRKLKKKSVKNSLKGIKSKKTTIVVKVGSKKQNKKYVKKYKKIFTKKNAGKKVKVK